MARPRTGHLHKTTQGQWVVKFMLNGERFTESLGHESELSEASLPHLRDALMRRVNNGEWTPKASAPRPVRARLRSEPMSTYRVFATLMFRRWCLEAGVRTEDAGDLRWKLSIFMDALGEHDLDAITERVIDLAKLELLAERAAVEQALRDGHPIMETAVGRGGRTYQRRKRGLDRNSINKGLKTVIRVLEAAKREGHIETVPRIAFLKARRPRRSFLHPIQIRAFFEAGARLEQCHRGLDWEQVRYIRSSSKSSLALARELHVSDVLVGKVRRRELWNGEPGPRNRNDVPRVAILKALVLAGPRADELCGLNGHHVDLAGRRLRIHRQGRREELKSEAGFRVVPMLPALHECLIEHRAGWPYPPEGSAFATRTGRANTPNYILNRIVSPAHA